MIRICHVQVLPILSGVQRAMLEIFKYLDRKRFEVHVACQETGPLTDELDRLQIAYHAIPSLMRPIRPLRDSLAYAELFHFFRRHRFQLVHTHSSKPGVLGRLAAHRAKVPLIVHQVQGFAFHEFSRPVNSRAYRAVERWAGRFSDRVIFVNNEERLMAIREGLLPAEKCVTIYNGVRPDEFDPAAREGERRRFRAEHQLSDDEVAIVFAGRLEPQKQPLILPKIAARLAGMRLTKPWRLFVAGSGPLESQLKEEIQQAHLADRIELLGWLENPKQLLFGGDLMLLPSLWEGLPLSLLEGHAAALPAVVSDIKGNREVVTRETGCLCRPREAVDYVDALGRLIYDNDLRARLGQAAREKVIGHFNSDVNMPQFQRLYDELLGRGSIEAPLPQAA